MKYNKTIMNKQYGMYYFIGMHKKILVKIIKNN